LDILTVSKVVGKKWVMKNTSLTIIANPGGLHKIIEPTLEAG
jgi:hypothetical protein